jgi:hypothetical protein
VKKLAADIQEHIKNVFAKHKSDVDRMNHDRKFGGPNNKNDKSERIYADLAEVSKQLSII